jgi:hypothetical protein
MKLQRHCTYRYSDPRRAAAERETGTFPEFCCRSFVVRSFVVGNYASKLCVRRDWYF